MRFDFHHYLQIDIDDWLLGRRHWATFVELATLLPRGSNYSTAVLDDDEVLSLQIERFGIPKPSLRPPLRGWDSRRDDMADVKDLLKVLINVTARSERPVTPTPRPETGMDRFEAAERRKNTDFLYGQLGIVVPE